MNNLVFNRIPIPDPLPEFRNAVSRPGYQVHDGSGEGNLIFLDQRQKARDVHISTETEIWIFEFFEKQVMIPAGPALQTYYFH